MLKEKWIKEKGKYYYLTSYGWMATGTEYIKGKEYYFKSNGVMHTGWKSTSNKNFWYYYGSDGAMYESKWLKEKENGTTLIAMVLWLQEEKK